MELGWSVRTPTVQALAKAVGTGSLCRYFPAARGQGCRKGEGVHQEGG